MPQVQIRRYAEILDDLVLKVVARAGFIDLEDSSIVKHILAIVARELDDSNYQLTRLQDLFAIERASGADLDGRAAEIFPSGLSRVREQNAIGYLVFSRAGTSGTLTIPAGTLVRTTDGIIVRTLRQGVITATSPEQITGHGIGRDSDLVSAIAETAGTTGNIAAGTALIFQTRPPGIAEVVNPGAFVRGRNAETDDEFRARIRLYITSLAACTIDALKYAVIGLRLADGQQIVYAHVAEDFQRPGNVTIYVDDGTGSAEQYLVAAPSGVGGGFSAPAATVQTFTVSSGPFRAEHTGRTITFSSATNGANNGPYIITSVLGSTQVTYVNAAGVANAADATVNWSISPEVLTAAGGAVGGEEYLSLAHAPVRLSSGVTIAKNASTLTAGTDYFLNPANGLIRFASPLVATDVITASYSFYTGLIELAHRVIDGVPTDRINYPGIRPAGVNVLVTVPTIVPLTIRVRLVLARGFVATAVKNAVEGAIFDHINTLGISGDVIRNVLIERIMSVPGVSDCVLELPATNLIFNDNELPRATLNNIDVL